MKICIFILGLVLTSGLFAQTDNTLQPPSFKDKIPACKALYTAAAVNNEVESNKEDERQRASQDKMLRFGKELEVSINFNSAADEFKMPNGHTLKRLRIKSKYAMSLNFIFTNFYLQPGATLFITDNNKNFIGAYTSINNNEERVLGTEILKADEVTLVLDEPNNNTAHSTFTISTIVHGYRDIDVLVKGLNTSGDCNVDVNCPAGSGWENQRNSVAMMVNGGGFCTGSLVHNTTGSEIPYFISARHCGTNPSNWVFRFRWEAPIGQTVCAGTSNSGNSPTTLNVNGATLKAANGTSDFILVLLNSAPNPNWGIYYNGWDRNEAATASSGTGIHHPDGDIKKISKENNPLSQQTISFNGFQNRTWRIADWDIGVTEPGSSGSPLFNPQKRLIGVLSGGTAACNGINDNNQPDYYGRFSYAWDNGTGPSDQLKNWLDPSNSGLTVLDGFDPNATIFALDATLNSITNLAEVNCTPNVAPNFSLTNLGTSTITTALIEYGIDNQYNLTLIWNGNLQPNATTMLNCMLTVPAGSHTFNARIASINDSIDENNSNNIVAQNFTVINPDFYARLHLELDCFASETSWLLKNAANDTLYTSPGYTDNQPDTIEVDFCLNYGCHTFTINDSYGDGMSGCNANEGGNGLYVLTNLTNNNTLANITEANADFGFVNNQNFCFTSSVGLQQYVTEQSIRIFPNPGTNVLNINSEAAQIERVTIRTIEGKLIEMHIVNQYNAQIDTQSMATGVYILQIQTQFGTSTQRWIKK